MSQSWGENWGEERRLPPLSAEMFAALVTARLRPQVDVIVEGGKGLELALRVRGQARMVHLQTVYERYLHHPDALSSVIQGWTDQLLAGADSSEKDAPQFAEIAPLLRPFLIASQQWMEKREAGLRLVVRPVVQDLGESLIVDRGEAVEYVQLEAIPAWGIEAGRAYELAHANLERDLAHATTTASGDGAARLLVDASPGAAARALSPSRRIDWGAQVEGELVLGLPTRDLLLGFSRNHPALSGLQAQVAEDALAIPGGLWPSLLCVRHGELEPLD